MWNVIEAIFILTQCVCGFIVLLMGIYHFLVATWPGENKIDKYSKLHHALYAILYFTAIDLWR